ncbi:hypothetical protein GCM10011507_03670 [Edaphobacter acidisoli]|uniref:D-apionate lactonase C-terminal domain-containing protein n=1 Tax=Edaphobacter acidisoli TaxID=2040573 RepID=A0A916RJ05_9BACT|nr:glycosyl hydrolase family 39 [Edaphobacter acidisoli]GGA55650.1 hypothetical protein GCM10011507_03670 [Edaphobacter acidisoli]
MLRLIARWSCAVCIFAGTLHLSAQGNEPIKLSVDWPAHAQIMRTTPTLQVVVNPMLRRGTPVHDGAFTALKSLGADYVRYVPWLPYPKLAVAELEPPTKDKTSWDFSLIDPMTLDFLNATEGHSRILNFSTIPAWLYVTPKRITYPGDPNQVDWNYTQGTVLRDPSCKELADYYARLVSWYTQGGFTDELGVRHTSGYHYKIPYWEVFNEIDIEHHPTPEQYTRSYDAIVGRLHAINPQMKFVALALAFPERNPEMFEYFLNHANHKPGIPLDMISYHFYATPTPTQTVNDWQYTFFDQAQRLLAATRYIESIRKRLSPETRTTMDEIGSILPTDWHPDKPNESGPAIPPIYWHTSGALYAYVFIESAKMGIDVVGESQLVGYPSQFPSVTMIDWTTGKPNARFEILRLILDNVHSGDQMATMRFSGEQIDALALRDASSSRLLLVNKRNREITISLPQKFSEGRISTVDMATDNAPNSAKQWHGSTLTLEPFAVVVVEAAR